MQFQGWRLQQAYIGGVWEHAADGRHRAVVDPATGETLGHVPHMGATETQRAVEAAAAAFPVWSEWTAGERAAVLHRWHARIVEAADALAALITAEQGKPLAEARGEIAYGAGFIPWFAEQARRQSGDIIPPVQRGTRLLVWHQPVGVCAAITPWNFPHAMVVRKLAPALAAGCTVVLKPAEQTPFSALALARLAEQAGIPPGVINVVTGDPEPIGSVLLHHPVVRKISFTGSTAVGRWIAQASGQQLKRVTLELGGNAPFIVCADADLAAAVEGAIQAKFRNNGQTCVCANRLLIHRSVYSAFTSALVEQVRQLVVGNGRDPGVQLGPLVDAAAVARVEAQIADALAKGAQVLTGGERLEGHFMAPTVLDQVMPHMRIAQEETFGPVAPLMVFDTEAEALAIANGVPDGLAAYCYTQDAGRAWRMAERLEYGMVGINTGLLSTVEAPFGGIKQSGWGREGSVYGLDDYTAPKYICWREKY